MLPASRPRTASRLWQLWPAAARRCLLRSARILSRLGESVVCIWSVQDRSCASFSVDSTSEILRLFLPNVPLMAPMHFYRNRVDIHRLCFVIQQTNKKRVNSVFAGKYSSQTKRGCSLFCIFFFKHISTIERKNNKLTINTLARYRTRSETDSRLLTACGQQH